MLTKSIASKIDNYLFSPGEASFLGICRMIFFGWLFLWYLTTDFSFVAEYPSQIFKAIPVLDYIGLSWQPALSTVMLLKAIWLMSLFLACVGFFTRTSIAISFFLGLYLLGLTHSFSKGNHSDAGLIIAMFILMFSRCGDAFSMDALRRAATGDSRWAGSPSPSGEYRWPVQLIRILWVLIFFLAGFAKLRNGGSGWVFSDSMAQLILRKQVSWEPPTELGYMLLNVPWLCTMMAIGAVTMELLAPLVLFSRLATLIIVPGMLAMQIGIRLIMGDDFTQFMSLYVFFVPWLAIGAVLQRRFSQSKIEVKFYGNSEVHARVVCVISHLDILGRISFRDEAADSRDKRMNYLKRQEDQARETIYAYDDKGKKYTGFDAYRRLAWVVPLGWLLIPALYLPGVPWAGRLILRSSEGDHVAGQSAM